MALLVVALTGCMAGSAFATVDGSVQQARDLVRAGKAAEAYRLLSPMTSSRAGDADFDYALGIAASDAGKPAEAIIALQRVLAVQPTNGEARAELARAYAMAGDVDTARKEFNTVVGDPTIPDPVRQRFTSIVSSLDRNIAGGGRSVTGYFEAAAGYDSNVNTATAATSLIIPLFAGLGPAALSGSAIKDDDAYGQITGGISIQQGLDRQNRVYASLLGSGRANAQDNLFNTATLIGTAGFAHSFADKSVGSLSGQAQGFWLDGQDYRRSFGGTAQYTTAFYDGALSSSIQYHTVTYPSDPLRDGRRAAVGLSYASKMGVLALQFGRERVDSTAQQFANRFWGLSSAFEYPLWGDVSAVSTLSGEVRKYAAADPLFLVRRNDRQIDASFGLRIPLGAGSGYQVSLRPQLTYTNNHSNIALYKYDRVTASVALRVEF